MTDRVGDDTDAHLLTGHTSVYQMFIRLPTCEQSHFLFVFLLSANNRRREPGGSSAETQRETGSGH